jgi:hypothetical protein
VCRSDDQFSRFWFFCSGMDDIVNAGANLLVCS